MDVLEPEDAERIAYVNDVAKLFDALLGFASLGATLRIHGTSMTSDVRSYLENHPGPDAGLGERSEYDFDVPLNDETLRALQEFAAAHAAPELCDHLIIHRGGEVLLTAYDAGAGYLYASPRLDPPLVEALRSISSTST